jgi:hypothetical protein
VQQPSIIWKPFRQDQLTTLEEEATLLLDFALGSHGHAHIRPPRYNVHQIVISDLIISYQILCGGGSTDRYCWPELSFIRYHSFAL